jgi:hypothetical protein
MWLFYLLLIIVLIAVRIYFWRDTSQINTCRNMALLGQEAPMLTQSRWVPYFVFFNIYDVILPFIGGIS